MFARMPSQRQLLIACACVSIATTTARGMQPPAPTEPVAELRWNSGVPDSREDGAATSMVGLNAHLRSVHSRAFSLGPFGVTARLAPEVAITGNGAFPAFTSGDPLRHPAASPFYFGAYSADLPSRRRSGARLWPGESGIWLHRPTARLGVATGIARWGPGVGEGLVIGRSAPGIARIEAQIERRIGERHDVRLSWFSGMVRESNAFDADPDNDRRSISGVRLTYDLADPVPLAFGVSRTVMDGRRGGYTVGRAARDALLPFGRSPTDSTLELLAADVTMSAASTGTLAWLETVRQAPVRSAGGLLRTPTNGLAFRLGLSQRIRATARATWTGELEFVRLDQPTQRSDEPATDLYTSATVVHGWTHDGQLLGSGLGPGGQRQVVRLTRESAIWSAKLFLERARWNEDALFRQPDPFSDRHDVTLQGGLAVGHVLAGYDVTASLVWGTRFNYQFEGASASADGTPADVGILRLGLSLRPRKPEGGRTPSLGLH